MDIWDRLRHALAEFPADTLTPPAGGRIGAALILLRDVGEGDLEFVYTRRRDDLRSHPGQISFPGGRVDPGETIEQAAIREAFEEVALDPATATVLGRLPPFYISPSRYWLQGVLARWDAPHPLTAAEAEVAEVLTARLSRLRDPETWRAVRMSTTGLAWAWMLDGDHLLWGATGVLTAVVLGLIDRDWTGGFNPADLPAERQVQPWERARLPGSRQVPTPGPARLRSVAERSLADLPAPEPLARPTIEDARRLGAAVAEAVMRLPVRLADGDAREEAGGRAPVTVLTGQGWTGAVGLAAAAALARSGRNPRVVAVDTGERLATVGLLQDELARGGTAVEPFGGTLPLAAVVVDALVGRGLRGGLRGAPMGMVEALRYQAPVVLAVDLPSGLDPETGLIGEPLPADVTVALGSPAIGLLLPGLAPFVGDLYVAPAVNGEPALLRVVPGPDGARWRE
ncbi:MAG: NUDIX domain-containing protein [Nitriliruptorales bacterium]|nr:NUDIX domain-containing protein [Nitriliruptorales bacterium]